MADTFLYIMIKWLSWKWVTVRGYV